MVIEPHCTHKIELLVDGPLPLGVSANLPDVVVVFVLPVDGAFALRNCPQHVHAVHKSMIRPEPGGMLQLPDQ